MAAKREQYGHNGGKFVKDMNNRKRKSKLIQVVFLIKLSFSETRGREPTSQLSGLQNGSHNIWSHLNDSSEKQLWASINL